MPQVNENDIALTTRVRLARNIKGKPFPERITRDDALGIIDTVSEALFGSVLKDELTLYKMWELSDAQRQSLVERHLISTNLASSRIPSAAIISRDERISVMINEEDHIRLQVFRPGLGPDSAYTEAKQLIRLIGEKAVFDYDKKFGYLTSCPTNAGTGMRVSVMLHLPAISITRSIDPLLKWAANSAMAVRGLYGEGSEASGALFQLSNQRTLGISETDILRAFSSAACALISEERRLCAEILQNDAPKLTDKCMRSLGILKNAYMISSSEAMSIVSDVCMGKNAGIINNINTEALYRRLFETMPASMLLKDNTLDAQKRDIKRAEILQSAIKEE